MAGKEWDVVRGLLSSVAPPGHTADLFAVLAQKKSWRYAPRALICTFIIFCCMLICLVSVL